MKAVVSGGIHLSVLDGWWAEAYTPDAGWAIGSGEEYDDSEAQTRSRARRSTICSAGDHPALLSATLEGLPRGWMERIKGSMRAHCPVYNTNRMVEEYMRCYYLPAHVRSRFVANQVSAGARVLAAWRRRMTESWASVAIEG